MNNGFAEAKNRYKEYSDLNTLFGYANGLLMGIEMQVEPELKKRIEDARKDWNEKVQIFLDNAYASLLAE